MKNKQDRAVVFSRLSHSPLSHRLGAHLLDRGVRGQVLIDLHDYLIGRLPLEVGQLLVERVGILQHRGTVT